MLKILKEMLNTLKDIATILKHIEQQLGNDNQQKLVKNSVYQALTEKKSTLKDF